MYKVFQFAYPDSNFVNCTMSIFSVAADIFYFFFVHSRFFSNIKWILLIYLAYFPRFNKIEILLSSFMYAYTFYTKKGIENVIRCFDFFLHSSGSKGPTCRHPEKFSFYRHKKKRLFSKYISDNNIDSPSRRTNFILNLLKYWPYISAFIQKRKLLQPIVASTKRTHSIFFFLLPFFVTNYYA